MESNNEKPPYSIEEEENDIEEEEDIEEDDPDVVDVDEEEEEESDAEAEVSDAEAEAEVSDAEAEAEVSDAEAEAEGSDAEAGEGDDTETGFVSKKKKGDKVTEKKKKGLKVIDGLDKLATAQPKKKTADEYMEHNDYDDEEEEDDDDDDNMNYLQKFDNSLRENFILDHHPEIKSHNYEEVKALTHVSRDGRGIIIDPLHKTVPFLTKYEMTRVIGQRAKQLDSGAKAFVKIPVNIIEGYHIAMLELEQKKMPFIIKRPYPNGGVEYWNVNDLEFLA